MEKRVFYKYAVCCFTLLFLILPAASYGLASDEYQFCLEWGSHGAYSDGNGLLNGAAGIGIDPSGNVYVANVQNHRIEKYDTSGNPLESFGCDDPRGPNYCRDIDELFYPIDVAVDPSGDYVYVADPSQRAIVKYDSSGNHVATWGPFTEYGAGFIKEPGGVAVDADGYVYVTDIWSSAIIKYDSDGNFLDLWTYPLRSGDAFRPTSIAVGSSGVYVTDYLNSYVYKLDFNGHFTDSWGGYDGTENGEFIYPTDIAVDSSENVFVADTLNNRIQKFDSSGKFITTFGASGEGQLDRPFGVGVDPLGNIVVADTFHHRLKKFCSQ